ncbi:TlpA disulfide reductase family protein [Lysobacter sp. LF1]|uniref:TlpA disulfide reductase family protein n=1 Tax=Lysobacter stagni TaxID=3045172 RepID=A0ABT6XFQ7_9GAMM|nr:TlpA disulfide reductase family protein [Lysobacter sp. LF1]MDI9238987.1 TlpA disulfide reductase family protein [Lysobacter sp. LF1]
MHRRSVSISLLAVALASAVLIGGCKKPAPEPELAQPQTPAETGALTLPQTPDEPRHEGDVRIPTLKIATVDGQQYDLATRRGKWVVVNFWATWCKPCLKEMPELSALDAMREHIEVVGLAYEDITPDDMKVFLKLHPVVYPIAVVDTFNPPADFATPRGLPMTYLIAPDGTVADKFLGPVTAKDIESAIAKAGGPKASQS